MIDLMIAALFQVVVGGQLAATEPPAQTPPAVTEVATNTSTEAAAPDEDGDRLRCRREPIVGTRLSRRICTTRSQERAATEDSRQMVDRAQRQIPLDAN